MSIDKIFTTTETEIAHAINCVIHNFMLVDFTNGTNDHCIKDAIEHRAYSDRYYRLLNHNEFSANPIPALVQLIASPNSGGNGNIIVTNDSLSTNFV